MKITPIGLFYLAALSALTNQLESDNYVVREWATDVLTAMAPAEFVRRHVPSPKPETSRRLACIAERQKQYLQPFIINEHGLPWGDGVIPHDQLRIYLELGYRECATRDIPPGWASDWHEYRIATKWAVTAWLIHGVPYPIIEMAIESGWRKEIAWRISRMAQ